ncbi:MAG TPA: DUF4276 family protein [Phycisphaerae bacterium]|nr:DUF4276 family protein [Phycisphaerae bacterium]
MSRLRVAPIVEGHGEVAAVPILLRRIWGELLAGEYLDVLQPVRVPRTKVVRHVDGGPSSVQGPELARAVALASRKIADHSDQAMPALILVLLDANSDCPAKLAPQFSDLLPSANVACVLARVEYETWFVGAADSLGDYLTLDDDDPAPADPEGQGCGKAWVKKRFRRYSETVDQPRMTAQMDLKKCRERSPSFDKLCRELQRRLT